mgnify:CR=1 FL=1
MEENDDADADSANFVPQIILMVILTLINAFFASAEMAVVSANKNKIKRLANEGNKKAKAVEKLCRDYPCRLFLKCNSCSNFIWKFSSYS